MFFVDRVGIKSNLRLLESQSQSSLTRPSPSSVNDDVVVTKVVPGTFKRKNVEQDDDVIIMNTVTPNGGTMPSNLPPTMEKGMARRKDKKRKFDFNNDNAVAKKCLFSMPPSPSDATENGFDKVSSYINQYYTEHNQTEEVLEKKLSFRNTIFDLLRPFGHDVYIVGSSINGFGTRKSDLDLCLMIDEDLKLSKSEVLILLKNLEQALRKCKFISKMKLIPAKVPILKLYDRIGGFECDLNINNPAGIRNSHLLNLYSRMDPRVRPLMLAVKHWARFHDINDAFKRTISSYSLALMLIFFLQAGLEHPVLPCLHKMLPGELTKPLSQLSPNENLPEWKSNNTMSIGELFASFLQFYARSFRYREWCVSVRTAQLLLKSQAIARRRGDSWNCLAIEEPFDGSNTARSVFDEDVFERILRVFRRSFDIIQRKRCFEDIVSHPF